MAPAVGIEPTSKVSHLVIKCHKVSYLYGYDGYKVSYFVIKIYIVSYFPWHYFGIIVGKFGIILQMCI